MSKRMMGRHAGPAVPVVKQSCKASTSHIFVVIMFAISGKGMPRHVSRAYFVTGIKLFR